MKKAQKYYRKIIREKYERLRKVIKDLPPLDKIENILGEKFLNSETFEFDFKRAMYRYFNYIVSELSSIISPYNFLTEVRSDTINGKIKKEILEFLKEVVKRQSIIFKQDLNGNYIEVIRNLWDLIQKSTDLYVKTLESIDYKKLEESLKDPDKFFEEMSRELNDFPKSLEEFEEELDEYVENMDYIDREVSYILINKINNYLSFIYEKLTGEEGLISYIEAKELGEEKRKELIEFFKHSMRNFYEAYKLHLERKYKEAIKILWKLYKDLHKKVLEIVELLKEIWDKFDFEISREKKVKYIV